MFMVILTRMAFLKFCNEMCWYLRDMHNLGNLYFPNPQCIEEMSQSVKSIGMDNEVRQRETYEQAMWRLSRYYELAWSKRQVWDRRQGQHDQDCDR